MLWSSAEGLEGTRPQRMAKYGVSVVGVEALGLRWERSEHPDLAETFEPATIDGPRHARRGARRQPPCDRLLRALLLRGETGCLSRGPPWWFRDQKGQKVSFWQGAYNMDVGNEEYIEHIARRILAVHDAVEGKAGIFLDNLRFDRTARRGWTSLLQRLRAARPEIVVLVNSGWSSTDLEWIAPQINGILYEDSVAHTRDHDTEAFYRRIGEHWNLLRNPRISVNEKFGRADDTRACCASCHGHSSTPTPTSSTPTRPTATDTRGGPSGTSPWASRSTRPGPPCPANSPAVPSRGVPSSGYRPTPRPPSPSSSTRPMRRWQMLQAMNTGHDGSLTTIHANSPRDALARTETLVLTAGFDLPLKAIRDQIASAFDLIIHTQRLVDGRRRITHITEVARVEGDVITLSDIFVAAFVDDAEGDQVSSKMRYTNIRPTFIEKLEQHGVTLPKSFFTSETGAKVDVLRRGASGRARDADAPSQWWPRCLAAAVLASCRRWRPTRPRRRPGRARSPG